MSPIEELCSKPRLVACSSCKQLVEQDRQAAALHLLRCRKAPAEQRALAAALLAQKMLSAIERSVHLAKLDGGDPQKAREQTTRHWANKLGPLAMAQIQEAIDALA